MQKFKKIITSGSAVLRDRYRKYIDHAGRFDIETTYSAPLTVSNGDPIDIRVESRAGKIRLAEKYRREIAHIRKMTINHKRDFGLSGARQRLILIRDINY